MSDFCSPDNPFDPTARDARDATRSQRREEQDERWAEAEAELQQSREPRDWTPTEVRTNYPRELTALALEIDACNRYDVAYRDKVRKNLVAARLANAGPGVNDWERDRKARQVIEKRIDRVEANRARRENRN